MEAAMKDSMTTYNGYEYNDCGVCVNPDKAYEYKDSKGHFKIKVSETPKGWVYGYDYGFDIMGGGGPCALDKLNVYPSRSKAIVDCANGIKTSLSFLKEKNPKMLAELDRIISKESGKKPRLKEFTIFDYL